LNCTLDPPPSVTGAMITEPAVLVAVAPVGNQLGVLLFPWLPYTSKLQVALDGTPLPVTVIWGVAVVNEIVELPAFATEIYTIAA